MRSTRPRVCAAPLHRARSSSARRPGSRWPTPSTPRRPHRWRSKARTSRSSPIASAAHARRPQAMPRRWSDATRSCATSGPWPRRAPSVGAAGSSSSAATLASASRAWWRPSSPVRGRSASRATPRRSSTSAPRPVATPCAASRAACSASMAAARRRRDATRSSGRARRGRWRPSSCSFSTTCSTSCRPPSCARSPRR